MKDSNATRQTKSPQQSNGSKPQLVLLHPSQKRPGETDEEWVERMVAAVRAAVERVKAQPKN